MDAKTLEALKGSIAKWEAIAAGTGGEKGRINCPLCVLFLDEDCHGCPVAYAAAEPNCRGTPFAEWVALKSPDIEGDWLDAGTFAATDHAKSIAAKERDFLIGLLPEDERP